MTAGDRIPRLLLPGLLCDDRLWRDQVTELEGIAAIQVPDLTRDDSVSAMAARVLAEAPPDQPTLIAGDDDRMTPPEESRILHAAIRNSRLHMFRQCGHLPAMSCRRKPRRYCAAG